MARLIYINIYFYTKIPPYDIIFHIIIIKVRPSFHIFVLVDFLTVLFNKKENSYINLLLEEEDEDEMLIKQVLSNKT